MPNTNEPSTGTQADDLNEFSTFSVATTEYSEDLGWFDRKAMSLFGSYFKRHRDDFSGFRKWMKQAQMTEGYDMYLSRALLWFVLLLGTSFTLSVIITAGVFVIPKVEPLGFIAVYFPESIQSLDEKLYHVGPIIIGLVLSLILSFLLAGLPVLVMYLIPWYRAGEREREIDTMLPYTVTFMYALSRGGANMINILRTVSESEDVYGEASNEFKMIIRDMEFFDTDLRSALRSAANTSPSSNFTDFVDDLISIVDTGGDIQSFLYDKTEESLLEARREQETFLDTLSLMAEIYVTTFVAGPLFVIIIITLMALISGGGETILYAIVYGVLPLGNLGFAFLIDILKSGKVAKSEIDEYTGLETEELEEILENREEVDERIENLYKTKRRKEIKELITNPVRTFRENPSWTLAVSTPLLIPYYIGAYLIYGIPTEIVSNGVDFTAFYIVVPLIGVLLPISLFHEMKVRRKNRILDRIPSMLNKLSSANATGMSLEESFEIVSRSTAGEIGDELKRVKNEMDWRGDMEEALIRFAQRIDTPRLSRTVKLITKAARSTGNITEVIDVASKDVTQTYRLEQDRKQELAMYTVIIIVAFLVYLLVIVMLNEAFLSKIASLSGKGVEAQKQFSGRTGFGISNLPVNLYNILFYHSTVVQAFGAGLIAGQMGSDDIMSGLKYSLGMVVVSTIVFMLI